MTERIARPAVQALAVLLLSLAGCSHRSVSVGTQAATDDAHQLVLVTTAGWNSSLGQLRTFAREGKHWQQVGSPVPVTLGRSGVAWGIGLHPAQAGGPRKVEGDGRSPAGVFRIGPAFGYESAARTGLRYMAMQSNHYCVDVSGSPLYNRIVDTRDVGEAAVAGSTEPMRRDLHVQGDQRYRKGFVIEHNPDGTAMAGSCIFAHLWKSPTGSTAGCTAMDAASMDRLLAWLRSADDPLFVLLPDAEYARLRGEWRLPDLESQR